MALLFITEYAAMAEDANGRTVPVGREPAVATQAIDVGAGNNVSAAFNSSTKFVKLHSDTTTHVLFGEIANNLGFDAGTAELTRGDVLTGGTSGANATILKVTLTSGTWAGNNAAGFISLGTIASGPYQNNETITDVAGGSADADGVNAASPLAISASSPRLLADVSEFFGVPTTGSHGIGNIT